MELAVIVGRLSRVHEPAAIAVWLNCAVPLLDGDTPLGRIACGDYEAVAAVVSGLESSGCS